jgi:hypothetical protein
VTSGMRKLTEEAYLERSGYIAFWTASACSKCVGKIYLDFGMEKPSDSAHQFSISLRVLVARRNETRRLRLLAQRGIMVREVSRNGWVFFIFYSLMISFSRSVAGWFRVVWGRYDGLTFKVKERYGTFLEKHRAVELVSL